MAEEAGADALSCINTLLGLAIDVEARRPKLAFGTGGLSGPAIRPIAVRMAWQAARAVRIPVIGVGGIGCAADALEFMLAGCRAVQIGTANFVDPGIYERVLSDLRAYLERHGLRDINAVVGRPDLPRGPASARGPGVTAGGAKDRLIVALDVATADEARAPRGPPVGQGRDVQGGQPALHRGRPPARARDRGPRARRSSST